jgi:hypothetical protein
MPVFFMLCSANVGSNHESVALKLTLSVVFKSMDEVLPNAIVIDRSWTEHNAFKEVIDHDERCWENRSIGGTQTKCKLLLCWFHVKKAWTENLLPKVKEEKRSELYAWMDRLMFCNSELQFNATYESFKKTYDKEPAVLQYVATGWAGLDIAWRSMWPLYNHKFQHGYVNTTNLVERLSCYVKYTLLKGEVNKRLDVLIWGIVGRPGETWNKYGGGDLLTHYGHVQDISASGKYSSRGVDKHHTTRRQRAAQLMSRYKNDSNASLRVIDEASLEFEMLSQKKPRKWYGLNLNTECCDCLDRVAICKHIMALKTIVDEQLQYLKQLLPLREAPFATFFHPDEDQIEGSISSMPSTSIEGTLISMMILNVFN